MSRVLSIGCVFGKVAARSMLLAALVGCMPTLQELPVANGSRRGVSFKEESVAFSDELRCYTYEGAPLTDIVTGRKIRNRQLAIETLQFLAKQDVDVEGFDSTAAKVAFYPFVPYLLGAAVINEVLTLPLRPAFYIDHYQDMKLSCTKYRDGIAALKAVQCAPAREAFRDALHVVPGLFSRSDILFQLGETYRCEGNDALARQAYTDFLDYSFMQYPDYFADYDQTLVNDKAALAEEFRLAEERSAP